jgi:predicted DNA-binding transcriptional regulator AlpA
MKLVLDAKELAEALSLPVTTVQQYASKYPEKLPPRLTTPSRKLLWAVKDVEAWVDQHRASVARAPESSGYSTPAAI